MTKTQIPFGDDNQNGKDNSNSKAEARRWRANYLHPTFATELRLPWLVKKEVVLLYQLVSG